MGLIKNVVAKHTHDIASVINENVSLVGITTPIKSPDYASVNENSLDSLGTETFEITISGTYNIAYDASKTDSGIQFYIDDREHLGNVHYEEESGTVVERYNGYISNVEIKNKIIIDSQGGAFTFSISRFVKNSGFMSGEDKEFLDSLK